MPASYLHVPGQNFSWYSVLRLFAMHTFWLQQVSVKKALPMRFGMFAPLRLYVCVHITIVTYQNMAQFRGFYISAKALGQTWCSRLNVIGTCNVSHIVNAKKRWAGPRTRLMYVTQALSNMPVWFLHAFLMIRVIWQSDFYACPLLVTQCSWWLFISYMLIYMVYVVRVLTVYM